MIFDIHAHVENEKRGKRKRNNEHTTERETRRDKDRLIVNKTAPQQRETRTAKGKNKQEENDTHKEMG